MTSPKIISRRSPGGQKTSPATLNQTASPSSISARPICAITQGVKTAAPAPVIVAAAKARESWPAAISSAET